VSVMPTIRIDEDVMSFLQTKAKPFVDSPNDVLRRILGIDRSSSPGQNRQFAARTGRRGFRPDKDYAHHSVRGFRLSNQFYPCNSFKEVLLTFCGEMRKKHQEKFDNIALALHGRKRSYFSLDPSAQRLPVQITGSGVFVETNLSANRIVGICQKIAASLGYSSDDFTID